MSAATGSAADGFRSAGSVGSLRGESECGALRLSPRANTLERMSSKALRMSTLFLRTLREDPADADVDSAKLLQRAGYVRKAAPGIWTWLPLGLRVLNKIENVVREEMDRIGAQEVHFPALLPREPYEATHRWEEYGENLFRLKDRHQADYLLAPTHEEMFTLLSRTCTPRTRTCRSRSTRSRPSTATSSRPRAGLIRGREFVMKDAYSFTIDEEGMKKAYMDERGAYERVFTRLDLKYIRCSPLSGPMGGSASEEFLAPMPIGEDTFALAPSGKAWNVEALTTPEVPEVDCSATPAMIKCETPDSKTIEALVETANRLYPREDGREWTAADTLKTVAVTVLHAEDEEHDKPWREVIAVAVPGDRQVDMKRLEAQFAPSELEEATEADLKAHPELVAGYMGPMMFGKQAEAAGVAEPVRFFIDAHVARGSEWIIGGDEPGKHTFHAVYGRDFEADGIVEAVEVRHGDMSPDGSGPLSFERGVEIGRCSSWA